MGISATRFLKWGRLFMMSVRIRAIPGFARLVAIAAFVALAPVLIARADPAAPARFDSPRAWFDDLLRRAGEGFKLTPNTYYEYRVESRVDMTPDEIAALRLEVKNKPNHPGRQIIRLWDLQQQRGPQVAIRRLWYANARLARDSIDQPTGGIFNDRAFNGEEGWDWLGEAPKKPTVGQIGLASDTLRISEPSTESFDRLNVLGLRSRLVQAIALGIGDARLNPADFTFEVADGVIRASRQYDQARATILAKWDPDAGIGRIFDARIDLPPPRRSVRWTARPEDWTWNPTLGAWYTQQYSEFAREGRDGGDRSEDRYEFIAILPISPQEVEARAATPTLDKPDPVRGLFESGTISRERSNIVEVSSVVDGRITERSTLDPRGGFWRRALPAWSTIVGAAISALFATLWWRGRAGGH